MPIHPQSYIFKLRFNLTDKCFTNGFTASQPVCCLHSLLQVALVFPNNDPVAFMVAFYGCLLAEVVPVPIEVPLSRKVGRGRTQNDRGTCTEFYHPFSWMQATVTT